MSEKAIETYLRKEVEKLGGLCLKFTSPSRRGVCDRIIISENGFTYYVETKSGRSGHTLSVQQKLFQQELAKRSVYLYVIASKAEVDKFINEIYF